MSGSPITIGKASSARAILAAWLLAAPIGLYPVAQPALAQSASSQAAAEGFVSSAMQKGLDILSNPSLSESDRRAQLGAYLGSFSDIRNIALFTLGPLRQNATPTQINQFVDAFRNYLVAAYESRLKADPGQSLRVTGCTQAAPGNYIVRGVLVDPAKRTDRQSQPIELDFRVVYDNGHYVMTDLGVAGLWLSLEKRDQFTNYLEDSNGNFAGLIVHLKALTERLHNGSVPAREATESNAQ